MGRPDGLGQVLGREINQSARREPYSGKGEIKMDIWYKVRDKFLGVEEESMSRLTPEEEAMSNDEFCEAYGLDKKLPEAITGEERAQSAFYPHGGREGVEKWAQKNPELAEVLKNFRERGD